MTAVRIRWEPAGRGGWIGYVGTLKPLIFQIREAWEWKIPDLVDGLVLASTLPGELGHYVCRDDPDELKAEAERQLEEFASSLGTVWRVKLRPHRGDAFRAAWMHFEHTHSLLIILTCLSQT